MKKITDIFIAALVLTSACEIMPRNTISDCKEQLRVAKNKTKTKVLVASPRIERGSRASEALILSIVLRGHSLKFKSQASNLKNKFQKLVLLALVFWFLFFILSTLVHWWQRSLQQWQVKLHQKICVRLSVPLGQVCAQ